MRKRICYIHVGPHKSGTTSIQWFLQENRAELLKHGYFVPESETKRGAHHALAEGLAGLDVGEHREPLVTRSIRAIAETAAASNHYFLGGFGGNPRKPKTWGGFLWPNPRTKLRTEARVVSAQPAAMD